MSKLRHALTSLLHRLGVTGPARVRVSAGSGLSKIGRGAGLSKISFSQAGQTFIALCALAGLFMLATAAFLALAASPASAMQIHVPKLTFGSSGSGAGQVSLVGRSSPSGLPDTASGLAVNFTTGDVYVADTGNHRVDQFSSAGAFIHAWGWGVKDGAAELQVCTETTTCRQGLSGTEHGELGTLSSSPSTTPAAPPREMSMSATEPATWSPSSRPAVSWSNPGAPGVSLTAPPPPTAPSRPLPGSSSTELAISMSFPPTTSSSASRRMAAS
jgi:NHL repeat